MSQYPTKFAPSERHLEDWIVANPDAFKEPVLQWQRRFVDQFIARQIKFADGVIDLIGVKDHHVKIIELKKERADGRALAQLLFYMQHVRRAFDSFATDMWSAGRLSQHYGFAYAGIHFVEGILVARDFDLKTYVACFEANVLPIAYEYNAGDYSFCIPNMCNIYDPVPGLDHLHDVFEYHLLEVDRKRGTES
jgi:hypothetical protein